MLRHISSYTHAVATTPAEQLGALVARLPQLQRPSLVYGQVGFRITLFEACSAFTHVTACVLAKSPKATLYTGGFSGFVASTTAPIATGWSDPCRVGFAPTEDVRLSTAHRKPFVTHNRQQRSHRQTRPRRRCRRGPRLRCLDRLKARGHRNVSTVFNPLTTSLEP